MPDCVIKALESAGVPYRLLIRAKFEVGTYIAKQKAKEKIFDVEIYAGATAFTTDDTIYFPDPKFYDPITPEGLGTIAHELKHVEQYTSDGHNAFQFRYVWEILAGIKGQFAEYCVNCVGATSCRPCPTNLHTIRDSAYQRRED